MIKNHSDKASIMLLSPDYDDAIMQCARLSGYSSTWTIIALSLVIARPIKTIYPAVNGEKDLAFRTLNTVLNPQPNVEPCTIMWTSVNKLPAAVISRKKTWTPNHFVPIIMTTNKDADTPKMTDPSTRKPTYADIVTPPIQHKTMLNQSTQQKSITLTQSPDSGLQTNKRRRSSSPVAMKSFTPIHSPESWIRPNKRRRSSGSLPSPVSVTLTNKYSNLSSMDNGDIAEFEFRSDNEISVDPPVTKKPKRKNDKIMKMDDSRIENYAFKSDSEKSVDSPIVKNKTKRNILLQMNISDASESISSEDNSCVKSGRVPVEGPHRGTLSNCKFLSTQQTLDLIAEAEDSLPEVPAGIKEDIFSL